MPYQPQGQPVHDPTILRAIAHPVRNRILTELGASGSMRAADVARELDIPANQASFHLRQLAKYGLVEEDPDAARDKRDRVWRPISEDGLTRSTSATSSRQPGGQAAAGGLPAASAARWGHAVVDAAYARRPRARPLRTVNEQRDPADQGRGATSSAEGSTSVIATLGDAHPRARDPSAAPTCSSRSLQPYPGPAPEDD